MVNKEVIRKRLNKLDEYLEILYSLRKYSFETFIGNPEHYGSTERFLHLSIEAINDIGWDQYHICSSCTKISERLCLTLLPPGRYFPAYVSVNR